MNNQAVPPGYTAIQEGSRTRVVKAELEQQLRELMTKPFEELVNQAGAQRVSTGRAGPIHLPAPGTSEHVLVRPYAHGGLLGQMRGREFSDPARAYRELAVCHKAQELNLPVSSPIGLTTQRLSNGKWHMEAWSWWITNATALSLHLPQLAGDTDAKRELMAAVAGTLKHGHDAGLLHGDLNARNIIVEQGGKDEGEPVYWKISVVDLDKAELVPSLTTEQRQSQIKRLFRSLVKERVIPKHLTHAEFGAFIHAYFGDALTEVQRNNFLKSCRRTVFWHSLLWRKP